MRSENVIVRRTQTCYISSSRNSSRFRTKNALPICQLTVAKQLQCIWRKSRKNNRWESIYTKRNPQLLSSAPATYVPKVPLAVYSFSALDSPRYICSALAAYSWRFHPIDLKSLPRNMTRWHVGLIVLSQIVTLITAASIYNRDDGNSGMLARLRVKRQWASQGFNAVSGYSGWLPNGYFAVNGLGVGPYGGVEIGSINLSTVNR
uniref:Cytochrome b561 domain-containing protein n=1 Tax=Ascaris lumbricoides TaxID=6252 RepID=A0A0M3ICW0_ASCLU